MAAASEHGDGPKASKRRGTLVLLCLARVVLGTLAGLATARAAAAQPTYYRVVEVAPADAIPLNASEVSGASLYSSDAIDIDPTGTFVVGSAVPRQGERRAFLWSGGNATWLGTGAAAGLGSEAVAVNASGQVVGGQGDVPYRWTSSTTTRLEAASARAVVSSINAAGQAVGFDGLELESGVAVLWPAAAAAGVGLPGGLAVRANDINDSGDIVGTWWAPPGGGTRAVRWSQGTLRVLEHPTGFAGSEATDINAAGQVVGFAWRLPPDGRRLLGNGVERVGVLWSGGTMMMLDRLIPAGINAAGHIVGTNGRLWRDGTTYDLTSLLDASGEGLSIRAASAISDDGKIAALGCPSSTLNSASCRAVLLVPAPPPPLVPAYTRYLAEGATSAFFNTRLALLNPGAVHAVAQVQYLLSGGAPITQTVHVPARRRATIDVKTIPGLAAAEFSIVVSSNQELVVDRTMSWDATGYGAHSETAMRSPASTWYLAEGATTAGFDLFYLLQNPAPTPTSVKIRYLRANGPPLSKTYLLPARSRTTIWVDRELFSGLGAALSDAEVSAVVASEDGTAILVERAMYRSSEAQPFSAGHEGSGVTSPATTWFFAEGATGDYFDLFILLANPSDTEAVVAATYLLPSGATVTRSYLVAPQTRRTVWVDQEDPLLADTAVSTTLSSTNDVPIVAERAMWWPGTGPAGWHEAHNSAGATDTGTAWAVAEGEVGGARGEETYLLIANTAPVAGLASVTLLLEDGTSLERIYSLPPSSRTNVAVLADFGDAVLGKRFGAVVESTGPSPVAIVVERATYANAAGVRWAAGSNALATKLK